MNPSKSLVEYVVIMVAPGIGIDISPVTPEIADIAEQATCQGAGWVANQLADLGFRVLEGSVLRTDAGKIDGTFFMQRERIGD